MHKNTNNGKKMAQGDMSSLIPDKFRDWIGVELRYDTPELLNPAFVHWELGPELPPHWEIGEGLTYSQEAIKDDTLIGIVSELERGKIVRQQIIGYNLNSREQKTIFKLPVDRVVYDPPAVYCKLLL